MVAKEELCRKHQSGIEVMAVVLASNGPTFSSATL